MHDVIGRQENAIFGWTSVLEVAKGIVYCVTVYYIELPIIQYVSVSIAPLWYLRLQVFLKQDPIHSQPISLFGVTLATGPKNP